MERNGAVVTLLLNRPDKLNALNEGLLVELLEALTHLDRDASVRAVVLTGAGGKAFAAGADIASMAAMAPAEARRFADLGHRVTATIEQSRLPFLAAINGFALGGGCELAMCCDILYASDKARLGQPEVTLGIMPGFGGTQRLARRVGAGKARELCLTGQVVGAQDALALGWVDGVFPHADLLEQSQRVATGIAERAPLAVDAIKRTILRGQDASLQAALEIEAASFAALFSTADQREGMTAFLQKRPPAFTGR
jgi:enoyl-CoA hydratase